ncbi:aminoglycoside phosphotransferase [Streptomyces sp. NPDC050504]|uniref:aminoglycoside phosphotransferase n=1 Tax=Streptomyces sp. NPDC050504 TaxID=3365618 RepID=UPI0037A4D8AF
MVERLPWTALPAEVRAAVAARVGGPFTTHDPRDGANCGTATLLTLDRGGHLFVKGQPDSGPLEELDREEEVNRVLPACAPRVVWRMHTHGWHLLAFEGIAGERADYAPGSPELPLVVKALAELGNCTAPGVRLMTAWDRWGYYCAPADRAHLAGGHLLHTDLAAQNVVIASGDHRAHLVDWAWPARGPAWADAALWAVRLISDGGHSPEQAHAWASKVPAWNRASPEAVSALARAEADSWEDAAAKDTLPEIATIVHAARAWADFTLIVAGTASRP